PVRRRYRRCRSAPRAKFVPTELHGTKFSHMSLDSGSLLDRVHPSLRKMAVYLLIYVCIGSSCFYLVMNQINGIKTDGILDSVYFVIVTMTTVGYGDLVPNSAASKLLACAFVFSGMALVCLFLSRAADYIVEKQETLFVKALHMYQTVGPTEILKEIESRKAVYKCYTTLVTLAVLVAVGTVFLIAIEKLDAVDAFYCVCSTITTLGYGDKSFSTRGGRVFAVFWILTSTVCVALLFGYIAEVNSERRQKDLVKYVLAKKMTSADLEAADVDGDGIVGAGEFIVYKMKEMGKISQDEISILLTEFESLDVDQSGGLSSS
ncbi:potassium channel, partial [Genlisea aurea]